MAHLQDLSVIIPVAAGDNSWRELVADLKALPLTTEILFVGPESPERQSADAHREFTDYALSRGARWIDSPEGRARQLNLAARQASRSHLWFLHADSRFARDTVTRLERVLRSGKEALYYFNLNFRLEPGLTPPEAERNQRKLIRLTDYGVKFRSRVLGLPFGDQGLCLSRSLFERLGGFPETASYGEDHLLVWKARHNGVPVLCTHGTLQTSARKYQREGWLKTTLQTGKMTFQQALPEWIKGVGGNRGK